MKNLTLIIPAKYEYDSLPIFLKELKNFSCHISVIIEYNDEKTKNCLKEFDEVEIIYQKKIGYGSAIIEGINKCSTEYCCIINADGSMNPKYLKKMLDDCKDNDFIFASRYLKPDGGSEDDTFITYIGNKIFTLIGNILFNLKISDILFTFILGKTSSFKSLNLISHDFRLCVEIPIKAKKKKLSYSSIACFERKRIAGFKKVNELKDGFLILCGMLNYIFKK